MKTHALVSSLLTLSFFATAAFGNDPVRNHDIVAEDYFSIGVISGCEISPDGKHVVYTELRWEPPNEKRNIDLWVVSTETRETTRLTFDSAGDGSPQWSADSQWIYFTSGRKRAGDDKPPHNGKRQIWRIRPNGSDLQAATRIKDGIGAFELSHDGQSLYYTVTKEHVADDAWKELRKQFDKLEYGHGVVEYHELWKLDLQNWRAEKLIDENRVIGEFTVSNDERRVAMLTTPTGELISNEGWSRVDVYEAATENVVSMPDAMWRAEAPSPYGWLVGVAFSSDGEKLSFRCDFDGYPGEIFVAHLDEGVDRPRIQRIDRPNEVYVGGHMEWVPGTSDLCFNADDHARNRVYRVRDIRYGHQGAGDILTPGDVAVGTFDISRNGQRIAAVMSTTTHPPEIFTFPASGRNPNRTRLTKVNPQVDTWKLPQMKTVQWKSEDGSIVEGVLELPPDYEPGKPLPTVIEIHGGPTAASLLRMRFWIYGRILLPARGWALLSPNYRGSTGYGDKFLLELIGHKNDRDVADILSGVDWLVEQGIADPDKLAVMGWSNGGYLTNCIITHTDRFKAASSGAGVFDVVTQWLAEDTPGHVINYSQGLPWDALQRMREASALYNVDKVKTPTLIHVGENDPRCPPEHSRGLYRALHHYLKVPTELIVYPGEGHGLTTYKHRKAKMEWDLKWFDHHVLGQPTEDDADPDTAVD